MSKNAELMIRDRFVYARPKMSSPPISVLPCRLLGVEHDLYSAPDGGQRLLQDRNLVIARHVSARQLQLFLASELNPNETTLLKRALTSCFLTGRSSSLVAASSIDGLLKQRYF